MATRDLALHRLDAESYGRIVETGALDDQRVEPPSLTAHPRTAVLVVEVAVTSGALDRGRKADLYAGAGVDECWIVDVPGGLVQIRRGARASGYEGVETYRQGDVLPSPAAGVDELPVAELLAGLVPDGPAPRGHCYKVVTKSRASCRVRAATDRRGDYPPRPVTRPVHAASTSPQ